MDFGQRLIELERRRRRGARLLEAGVKQAEVATRWGHAYVSIAMGEAQTGGRGASAQAPQALRSPKATLRSAVRGAHRAAQGRCDGSGLCHRAVDTAAHTHSYRAALCRETHRTFSVAAVGFARLERAAADGPGTTARRESDSQLEGAEVARTKKIAARQGRIIVFIDESGLSERPCRARTWAPRGETPILQYSFSWKQLSVIAGISFWRFYFRFFPGSIKSPQIVEFLKVLQATIGRKLLIVWDRLQAHRSRMVRDYVEAQRGQIALECLPAYAPKLNPVEYIWGYLKHHAMPNFCARDLTDLKHCASSKLRSMQRRLTLVSAFWQQAELF